jgi:subtilisin family serine protease
MFSESPVGTPVVEHVDAPTEGKLRHPQLRGRDGSAAGKDGTTDSHLFLAFNEYEADGVTRRTLDSYGISRRVLEEYGVSRRVMDSYGVTRRVMEEYGVTRRVMESYGVTRRVLSAYGITAEVLEDNNYQVTQSLLHSFGTSMKGIEAQGVSRRVLEEYGVTRRMMDAYGLSDAQYDAALAAWERTIRLKVRIDSARPGIFISLGALSLETFLEEIADDSDIAFVEVDLRVHGPAVGSVSQTLDSAELTPWGVESIGSAESASLDASSVHVFVLDSGVLDNDLNVVEQKDFTMLFLNRDQAFIDEDALIQMPFFDPGDRGNPADQTGHGSHIAGTVAALANGTQVVGVAPGAKIHSLKIMTETGETDITTLMAAIDYVIAQRLSHPTTPMVMNLSLGMNIETTSYNVLDEAIRRAYQNNILSVVSAGNSAMDASTYSPAHVAEALTVGSYGQSGSLSAFSNFGSVVDLHAPGDMIASLSNNPTDVANNYAILESGTSMAAGHVTGAAALILAESPQVSPGVLTDALLAKAKETVTAVPSGTTALSVWAGSASPRTAPSGGPSTTTTSSTSSTSTTSTTTTSSPSGTSSDTSSPSTSTNGLPPFYNFAITAGFDIDIYSATSLWTGFEDASSSGNASVFANQFLDLDNSLSEINGFSYNGSPYVRGEDEQDPMPDVWATWMEQVPQPNYNPAGIPGNVSVDPIAIPRLDVQQFKSQATRVSKKNLVLNGHYDLGTKENPTVWYVDGNVTTRGEVTFSGYGVFLTKGTITINNSITNSDMKSETMLGLYANNTITFKSAGLTVAAHVFTNSSVLVLRDLTLYGNITAGGNVSWKSQGHNQLYFREAPKPITDIFWPVN